MFVEALQRPFLVCAQADVKDILDAGPGHWSVISIREPSHPRPDLTKAKRSCEVLFADQEHLMVTCDGPPPSPAHLEEIFRFAEAEPSLPLLVHCWAGRSRSSAVALALIAQELWKRDVVGPELIRQAVDILLALRPFASPNSLVLRFGLDLFLPAQLAESLTDEFRNEPRLLQRRTGFIP